MWTDEQRKRASEQAKARWADPFYRANHGKSIQKPPLCPSCGETDISKFYLDKKGNRTNKICKTCHKKNCNERWHSMSAIEKHATRVSAKYGISADEYKQMHEKQNGKCKICNEVPATKRGLHVDHCHDTGKVRGLLCHGCNLGIGSMKDSIHLLEKAIEYLRSN